METFHIFLIKVLDCSNIVTNNNVGLLSAGSSNNNFESSASATLVTTAYQEKTQQTRRNVTSVSISLQMASGTSCVFRLFFFRIRGIMTIVMIVAAVIAMDVTMIRIVRFVRAVFARGVSSSSKKSLPVTFKILTEK